MPLSYPKTIRHRLTSRLLIAAVAVASVVTAGAATAESASAATPADELVVNADFSAGVQNWRTNLSSDRLTASTVSRSDGKSARIDVGSPGITVLNDSKNTVSAAERGAEYRMTAWVKASREVTGQIRAREVADGSAEAYKTESRPVSGEWTQLTMDFTVERSGAALDLNVVFAGAAKGDQLYVDSVSLKSVAVDAPQENPTVGQCAAKLPLGDTRFGVSLGTSDGSSMQEGWDRAVQAYGTPDVVRVFQRGAPNWNVTKIAPSSDLSISFKIAPKDVLSGAYDSRLRSWFQSAPTNVQVYWTYFHEPEDDVARGEITSADYRAAWQRISSIADETCRSNLHATLVLMSWTLDPKSNRDFDDYYPGSAAIDVLAWDPYNPWNNNTGYKDPEAIFGSVIAKSKAEGKPFGIAETGSTLMGSDTGVARAAWLREIGAYLRDNDALFVSYYDAVAPSDQNDFRLRDTSSVAAWRALVQG